MGRRGIITIDGPAGAGKSTVARRLAQILGYLYLDSGALYRAVAWQAARLKVDLKDPEAVRAFLKEFRPQAAADGDGFRLLVDGRDISTEIRSPEVSRASSRVAVLPEVRLWVQGRLRLLGKAGGVVAEGRDQGTVVFPDAAPKFFLDAALGTRATRRLAEWSAMSEPPPLSQVMDDLAARDQRDATRELAPLAIPDEAVVIDTTDMTIEQVVERCLREIGKKAERRKGEKGKTES